MAASFRAAPWISYEPAGVNAPSQHPLQRHVSGDDMDEDVDMDAPQISTLRTEDTPPPQPSQKGKFKLKLHSGEHKVAGSSSHSSPRKPAAAAAPKKVAEEDGEDEEEEDQLIDDDEEGSVVPPPPPPPPKPVETVPVKRKRIRPSTKKTPAEIAEKRQRKNQYPVVPDLSVLQDGAGSSMDVLLLGPTLISTPPEALNIKVPPPPKKRVRKAPSTVAPKAKITIKPPREVLMLSEDVGQLSDTHTGASSPVTFHPDNDSPESDVPLPMLKEEELFLDPSAPIPVYPLPTKPFPVQQAPKIPTGFAPALPLDKSKHQVRRWRVAHREIRGIAGGRWFARTWVGEKTSVYATEAASASATPSPSKPPQTEAEKIISISAGVPIMGVLKEVLTGPGKLGKGKKAKAETSTTNTSRAGSAGPPEDPYATRAPTKMRIMTSAAEEGAEEGDEMELDALPVPNVIELPSS